MTGEYLSKRIKAAQFTQKELAARMNVVPQLINAMFKSKSVGSEKLEQVCKAIGKPMNFLYEGYEGDAYTYFPEPIIVKDKTDTSDDQKKDSEIEELKKKYEEKLEKKDEQLNELIAHCRWLEHNLYSDRVFEKTENHKMAMP